MSNDAEIEKMIIDKGKTGPRVTIDQVLSKIDTELYFRHPTGTLMTCAITLKNGFIVTGESACADPANFDEEIGRKISRGNAIQKIWGLEGYLLREQLYSGTHPSINAQQPERLSDGPYTPDADDVQAKNGDNPL